MYGTIEIDGPHVEGASKSYAAERRPYDFETRNLVRQMRHGINHDMFGSGDGSLGTIASSANATSFIMDDVRGIEDNLRIDVVNKTTGAVQGGVIGADVTVAPSTKTVTISTSGMQLSDFSDVNSNPTNYKVYRSGSRNMAPFGLEALVSQSNPSTGNVGGIDRTASGNEFWQSQRLHNSGVARDISLPLIQDGITLIEKRSNGQPNLILCGYEVWTILMNELIASKRWDGKETKLNGWARALMFNDVPIVRDKHCPPETMFILDTNMFTLYQNDEGKWMDEDGAILSRVPGRHAYQAAWFKFCELVCHAPNAQCRIEDLATTTPI